MKTHAGITINRGALARSYIRGVEFSGGCAAVAGVWAGVSGSWLLAVMGGIWLLTSGLIAAFLLGATASPKRAAAQLTQGQIALGPPLPDRQQDVPAVVPLLLTLRHGSAIVEPTAAGRYPRSWE
jgi:hypothetical protein